MLAISGCGSTPAIIGSGPHTVSGPDQRPGLRYFLGKDQIVVRGTAKWRYDQWPTSVAPGAPDKIDVTFVTSEGNVQVETIADPKNYFIIDLEPDAWSDARFGVELKGNGTLSSVNTKVSGRAGDVIKNVTTFLATAASIVAGVPPVRLENTGVDQMSGRTKIASSLPQLTAQQRCTTLVVPIDLAHLLRGSESARRTLTEIERLCAEIEEMRDEQLKLYSSIRTSEKAAFETIPARITALENAITSLTQQRATKQAVLDAQLAAFRAARKWKTWEDEKSFQHVFDVADLPDASTIRQGMDVPAVDRALASNAVAKVLFDRTRIVITLRRLDGVLPGTPPPAMSSKSKSAEARVFYRQPTPVVLSTYALRATATPANGLRDELVLIDERLEQVLVPNAPTIAVDFDEDDFSEREIALVMDDKGNLIQVKKSSTSSAAAITGALAESATGGLDAYSNGLTKITTIQKSLRETKLHNLLAEQERLQAEKKLVDARLELAGANATYEMALEQKTLNAKLDALKAEQNLAKQEITGEVERLVEEQKLVSAQLALQSGEQNFAVMLGQQKLSEELKLLAAQLALDKAESTNATILAIEKLKQEIELLKQQVELAKLKQ